MRYNIFRYVIRIIASGILFLVSSNVEGAGRTVTKAQEFSGFDCIATENAFEVVLRQADTYSVEWTVDEAVKDFVEVYSKGKTLHLEYNEKGMPSEIKKLYKGRNAPKPVLKAVVYLPVINEINIAGKAKIEASGIDIDTDSFVLKASGSSRVDNLSVRAREASIDLSKSAAAYADINAGIISIRSANSSSLRLKMDSSELDVETSGSSELNLSGIGNAVTLKCSNSSKVALNGSAANMVVSGSNSSEVEGADFVVEKAEVILSNSSKTYVHATGVLSVNLRDNSHLVFSGDPIMEIGGIHSSSLTRYSDEKKK